MKLDDAIENRRSIRKFSDKKVKWEYILEAIDAAKKAPFAGNQNNLKFIIIQEKNKKIKIARNSQQEFISDAPAVVIVCSDIKNLQTLFHEHADLYARQQAGAAIQNFLLKITDQKLSSCWIGAFEENLIKKDLKIPPEIQIEAILPVGHALPTLKIKTPRKKSLDNLIYWETWKQEKKPIKTIIKKLT